LGQLGQTQFGQEQGTIGLQNQMGAQQQAQQQERGEGETAAHAGPSRWCMLLLVPWSVAPWFVLPTLSHLFPEREIKEEACKIAHTEAPSALCMGV
jgi:hypothetical protein